MHRFIKEYFCFSRGERNGTIVLAAVMVLVFLFPYIYNAFRSPPLHYPDPEFLMEVEAFYKQTSNGSLYSADLYTPYASVESPGYHSDVSGHRAGSPVQHFSLPDSSAGSSAHPHSSAGSSGHHAISPDNSSGSPGYSLAKAEGQDIVKINVNSTDTSSLMQIRGIGPVLSRRILRYRDILGGYYHLTQLKEVYGIDTERYVEIEPYLYADTSRVFKLRPCSDEFGVLLRHPYLDYEQVSEIFRLRNSDRLHKPADLLQSSAFEGDDVNRLSPYLDFE